MGDLLTVSICEPNPLTPHHISLFPLENLPENLLFNVFVHFRHCSLKKKVKGGKAIMTKAQRKVKIQHLICDNIWHKYFVNCKCLLCDDLWSCILKLDKMCNPTVDNKQLLILCLHFLKSNFAQKWQVSYNFDDRLFLLWQFLYFSYIYAGLMMFNRLFFLIYWASRPINLSPLAFSYFGIFF